ncbi:aminodeoxychorismate synthase component I [Thiocystis violascens]|uniref:aminodeoxychorismate synthase n=1 Tax=Thiocystis violascens (strain ATCC 17096 / DSM 198 / 6111) TaxID=765911 RepID=I3YDA2_THIV6|nr:aminodeoxychorismate synthase component I [Thiocystis violascens]AFL74970.1 aminodeoxychorismate synthase, component I [Thiocystis violascens DSM 198]
MTFPLIQDLPYRPDSADLFDALTHRAWPVFLDSGRPFGALGRYDVLSADPGTVLVTRGLTTRIQSPQGIRVSLGDPFDLLGEALGPTRPRLEGLPFCGGAIGYFGYDLSRRFIDFSRRARDLEGLAPSGTEGLPDMAIGIYDWALVVDHAERRSRLFAPDEARLKAYSDLLSPDRPKGTGMRPRECYRILDRVRPNMSHGQYLEAIARIKRYLHEGDCYQVNFAQCFAAPAQGDPWDAYRQLRRINPAPFGAYLATPDGQVLCSSPERFLTVRAGGVETQPIKGTRPRGETPDADRRLTEELRLSPKDRAENVMIVDLLRNDLGKVCVPGSVQVPRLFEVERYARIQHLVSTVTGRLAENRTALDLLRACFPGGSITGAPKRRAMEIIEELEPQRRGVYCGALGYLGFDGAMETNIVIRTLIHANGIARLWAGGGIVADSDPESEYRETYHKAAPLLDLLEQRHLRRSR